jgi:choice-of-anchor B domain-containing protein
MKHVFKIAFGIILVGYSLLGSAQSVSKNIELLGKWNNPQLPKLNGYQIWSDLTTYYDSLNKREYVIAGSTDSIYFFDITNPANIVLCAVESGNSRGVVNRDFECYSHYVYCVSDNGARGSLQVFDMRYLPDSVHKVYDSDSLAFNTHSIFIEAKSKRLYMCINRLSSGGVAGMDILSLENPEKPKWVSRLKVPTFGDGAPYFRNVHEVFVRNDTAYCSVEYHGIWIFDLRDLNKQRWLTAIREYPENGYNHSSSLDPTGRYLMFTDEIPKGMAIKIFDIQNIFEPKLVSLFRSNPVATAHNAHWVGNFAYVSYYHDGVYVFDLSNPAEPIVAGYYHTPATWPPESYDGYKGCWGVNTWLPSGNVVATDMTEGIFVLKPDPSITHLPKTKLPQPISVFPNPFTNQFQTSIPIKLSNPAQIKIHNLRGELLLQKISLEPTFETETNDWPAGIYTLQVQTLDGVWVQKIIKQ